LFDDPLATWRLADPSEPALLSSADGERQADAEHQASEVVRRNPVVLMIPWPHGALAIPLNQLCCRALMESAKLTLSTSVGSGSKELLF
jgi:hypothetical protein